MYALSQLTDFLHCSFQFKKAVSYAIYTNLYFDGNQIIFSNCVVFNDFVITKYFLYLFML